MRIRFKIIIFFFLLAKLFVGDLSAQTDSLINEFRKTPKTTLNIPKLIEITNRLSEQVVDSALNCAYQIDQIALIPNEYELQCKKLLTLGTITKTSGKYDESNKYLHRALEIAEKNNLISSKIICLYQIGDLNRCIGLSDQSLQYLYLSLNFARKHKTNQNFPQIYDRISSAYFELASPNNKSFDVLIIPDQKELGPGKNSPEHYIELCKLYADSALFYSELTNNIRTKLSSYNILGAYYRYTKDFKKAIENFTKAIVLAEQNNIRTDIPNFYTNIAQTYLKQKLYKKAIESGLIAFHLADKQNILVYKSTSASILRLAYIEVKDYKNALTYQHIEAGAREEMNSQKNWNTISELGKKYQSEQKQKEIEYQKNLLLLKNAQINNRNKIIGILVFASIIILIGIVIIILRNAKLKTANNIIIIQNEELNRINNTKNKLISIIAHDLRGPLGNLSDGLKFIADNTEKKDTAQVLIPMLSKQADITFNMLDNLLHWVRNQLQNPVADIKYNNLYQALSSCLKLLSNCAEDKNIEIKLNATESVSAYFDKEMVTIIVRNLVSNAIKFTSNGGSITVSAFQSGKQVIVEVADTGIGFQQINISRITDKSDYFTSFGTNAEKGTGLGLKICSELIEKNGGKLQVKDNFPQGTIFYFNLSGS